MHHAPPTSTISSTFLDASPSPWHVVRRRLIELVDRRLHRLDARDAWTDVPPAGFVVRGAALVAWQPPAARPMPRSPFRLVGAHTDSPCLRVKPRPDTGGVGWKQLGVEVYGGVLHQLVARPRPRHRRPGRSPTTARASTVDVDEAVCRVPQLAIHLDRDVNERGWSSTSSSTSRPVWGSGSPRPASSPAGSPTASASPARRRWWDLCLFDRTPPAVLGADRSLLAAGRLDNQVSCWAAVDALLRRRRPGDARAVIALFDHEEVGSESTTGAAGPLLEHVLERLALATWRRPTATTSWAARRLSTCVSADNAHAVHPNYPERHEPGHRPIVNQGPAIKLNSNQRYATSAATAAMLQRVFDEAGVPSQVFVSRNNMPCGTTIGPITATRLGIDTVDVGVPQLSMHSARELCGVDDPVSLAVGLRHFFDRVER